MKLKFEITKYNSKLATIMSLLKSGIVGWIFIFIILNIPSIIVVSCVDGMIGGIMFGVMGILSIILHLIILFKVDTDKIEVNYLKKHNKELNEDNNATQEQVDAVNKFIEDEKKKQEQKNARDLIDFILSSDNDKTNKDK